MDTTDAFAVAKAFAMAVWESEDLAAASTAASWLEAAANASAIAVAVACAVAMSLIGKHVSLAPHTFMRRQLQSSAALSTSYDGSTEANVQDDNLMLTAVTFLHAMVSLLLRAV